MPWELLLGIIMGLLIGSLLGAEHTGTRMYLVAKKHFYRRKTL